MMMMISPHYTDDDVFSRAPTMDMGVTQFKKPITSKIEALKCINIDFSDPCLYTVFFHTVEGQTGSTY